MRRSPRSWPARSRPGPLDAPFVGRGNTVPGIPYDFGLHGGVSIELRKALDLGTIDSWLDEHGFRTPDVRDPTGATAVLDEHVVTMDQVLDRVMQLYRADGLGGLNMSYLTRQEILDHLRQHYVATRGGPGNQIVFGYTLVPSALQFTTAPPDALNPTRTQHQFSFTITRQHHANDSPGLESSFQGAVTFDSTGSIANVQAGGQEAIVRPLLDGWFQVSGFVQLMIAANWSRTARGSTVITEVVPTAQLGVGGQLLLTPNPHSGQFAFLRGHVQVGVQVVGAGTTPLDRSGPPSLGLTGGLILNIPF